MRAVVLLFGVSLFLSACNTTNALNPVEFDKAQGSSQNISSLTEVVNRNPRDANAYNVRGAAYGRAGRYSSAIDDFNTALRLNSQFADAYSNRALVYQRQGNAQQAKRDYDAALRIDANNDDALVGRADLYRAVQSAAGRVA